MPWSVPYVGLSENGIMEFVIYWENKEFIKKCLKNPMECGRFKQKDICGWCPLREKGS